MQPPKLKKLIEIITRNLESENIPFAVIGAFALGAYGLPRYTSDVDLLTEGRFWRKIQPMMNRLGYACFQKTDAFAQFDSDLGVLGRIDIMFVHSQDGQDMLKRRVYIQDELTGRHPVIQPTDYIILKLMAIANNPDRAGGDEMDIANLLTCRREGALPEDFEPLDENRLIRFAERFGQKKRMMKLLDKGNQATSGKGGFFL